MFTVIYNLIAVVYKSFRHFELEWYNHMTIPSQRIVTFTLNGKLRRIFYFDVHIRP